MFIFSAINGHLFPHHSTIWLLWIMMLWTWAYKYVWDPAFGYISRSVFAGLYDNSMFNFLKNCRTVFHYGSAILQGFQFLYIYGNTYHLLWFSLITGIIMDVKWYFIVFLIWISPIISDVEHLLMSFMAILYLLGEMSIQVLYPFLTWLFCHWIVKILCIFCILIRFIIWKYFLPF